MPAYPTTRKRDVQYQYGTGVRTRRRRADNSIIDVTSGSRTVAGKQITVSEGHPFKHKYVGADQGGNFYSTRTYVNGLRVGDPIPFPSYTCRTFATYPGNTLYHYNGPVFPVNPADFNVLFPPEMSSTDDFLYLMGTTAIDRCKPGQPVADLTTSMAELIREGIPAMLGANLWKSKTSAARRNPVKGGASEYLNYVFGWSPLVADVRDVAKAFRQRDALLAQYEKDAGKLVRRGYNFPIERSSDFTIIGSPFTAQPYGTHAGAVHDSMSSALAFVGTLERSYEASTKRWFRGAFTYSLPSDYHSRNQVRGLAAKAKVLLGVELTPEVLWNLAPWSWAADWVANYGDVLSNVSDFSADGLVMSYGYIMEETRSTYTYTLRDHGIAGIPQGLSMEFSRVTKKRVKASPFGFGLTWESFSPRQLSILAAIGISR